MPVLPLLRIFKSIVSPPIFVLCEYEKQNEKFSTNWHAALNSSTPVVFHGLSLVLARRCFSTRNGFQHFLIFCCASLPSPWKPAESGTPELLQRHHSATAKLACDPLVAWLSARASFDVGSGLRRKRICGARAQIGEVGYLSFISYWSWVLALSELLGTGSPSHLSFDWTKLVGLVLVHFVH